MVTARRRKEAVTMHLMRKNRADRLERRTSVQASPVAVIVMAADPEQATRNVEALATSGALGKRAPLMVLTGKQDGDQYGQHH